MNYKSDIFKLYVLFFLAVITTYKAPHVVSLLFQIILFVLFWRSKKDYFWLAFVFIIESYPGALFSLFDKKHTFSLLHNTYFGELYFWIIFVFVALLKLLKKRNRYNLIIKNNLYILFIYFIFIITIFGIFKFQTILRQTIPWLCFFIFPKIFVEEEDYINFFNLIFSFVPIVIIFQLYQLFYGNSFSTLLGGVGNISFERNPIETMNSAARPVDGIMIPYLSILGSLLLYNLKKFNVISKNYIYFILALSVFSIFLTATRTWLVSSILLIFSYFFVVEKNIFKILNLKFIVSIFLVIIIFISIPIVKRQVNLAWKRYLTIEFLAQGDITAGGTADRFSKRAPRLIKKFKESPIIGWGYGAIGAQYGDRHLGNQNLLLHTGIIGYTLFLFVWLNYFRKLYLMYKMSGIKNIYRSLNLVFILYLVSILILNYTAQWFGYLVSFINGFVIVFIFTAASFFYNKQLRMKFYIIDK